MRDDDILELLKKAGESVEAARSLLENNFYDFSASGHIMPCFTTLKLYY